MGVRRLLLALAFGVLLGVPAVADAATPTVVHGWRVNLDGDAHLEHVRLMLAFKPNPFGGTVPIKQHWLQVVDRVGGQVVKVRVTPIVEHMQPRWIRIQDLNGRGRPEIFYRGFNGGAGNVPLFACIRGWNGTSKRRFWSYAPPYAVFRHNGRRYYYAGANVSLENLANAATPGLEVHLVTGERLATEPDCCPSQSLTRNYRFSQIQTAWLLYQTVWNHS
jgi:hypothetical protein